MRYSVKQADARSAEGPFVAIWRANLQVQGDPEEQYRWHYVDNPTGTGSAFLLTYHSERGADAFVGCCGVGRRTFAVRGRPITAALMGDFAVDRGHRTVMPALVLQRTIQRHLKAHFPLAYGFPNQSAIGVFRRIGYREIGSMVRYARVLRHAPYLGRMVRVPLLARAGGAVLDAATLAMQVLRAGPALVPNRLEWLDRVDARFDELWEGVCPDYPLLGFRGAGFLRWRFMEKPGERFEIAALVERHTRRLRAYAVLQQEGRIAHVRDFLGTSEQELSVLLDRLVLSLQRREVDSVSVRFLGATRVRRVFEKSGFIPREGGRSVIAEIGDANEEEAALLGDKENWFLTDADEDV